jgi:PleD family two-component response regulator
VRRLDANPREEVSVDQAELAALHKTTLALLDRQNPEDLLETIVERAGALIDVALALRREQRAAVTDALTGLLNRRAFDERLREELERAAHTGDSVALVMVDCDGLKTTNDTGGHELGDRVLQSIARCLRTNK